MPTRTEITAAALAAAQDRGWPLFTGNGFLCRETMALAGDPGHAAVLPLHGGMGLAGGVAAGYILGGAAPGAVILEGDGNHLMGWGCAQLIGSLGLNVLHIVAVNGLYESTGGQPVPFAPDPDQAVTAASVLGYSRGAVAHSPAELQAALNDGASGSVLVYAVQTQMDAVPPRSPYCTADYADALGKAAGRQQQEHAR